VVASLIDETSDLIESSDAVLGDFAWLRMSSVAVVIESFQVVTWPQTSFAHFSSGDLLLPHPATATASVTSSTGSGAIRASMIATEPGTGSGGATSPGRGEAPTDEKGPGVARAPRRVQGSTGISSRWPERGSPGTG